MRSLFKGQLALSGASTSAAFDGCDWIHGGGLNKNPSPGVDRHVLNSSTTAACRICGTFWAFQKQRSLCYRIQGVIMLSRALLMVGGSNCPVTLHASGCSLGPPSSVASAAEASLSVLRSPRASFLSGVSPAPGSRRRLSRFAASDMGPFSWAYAADFGVVIS